MRKKVGFVLLVCFLFGLLPSLFANVILHDFDGMVIDPLIPPLSFEKMRRSVVEVKGENYFQILEREKTKAAENGKRRDSVIGIYYSHIWENWNKFMEGSKPFYPYLKSKGLIDPKEIGAYRPGRHKQAFDEFEKRGLVFVPDLVECGLVNSGYITGMKTNLRGENVYLKQLVKFKGKSKGDLVIVEKKISEYLQLNDNLRITGVNIVYYVKPMGGKQGKIFIIAQRERYRHFGFNRIFTTLPGGRACNNNIWSSMLSISLDKVRTIPFEGSKITAVVPSLAKTDPSERIVDSSGPKVNLHIFIELDSTDRIGEFDGESKIHVTKFIPYKLPVHMDESFEDLLNFPGIEYEVNEEKKIGTQEKAEILIPKLVGPYDSVGGLWVDIPENPEETKSIVEFNQTSWERLLRLLEINKNRSNYSYENLIQRVNSRDDFCFGPQDRDIITSIISGDKDGKYEKSEVVQTLNLLLNN